ncbi:MAG: hypothetical protein ACKOPM_00205 [Novosphingobium sp.]
MSRLTILRTITVMLGAALASLAGTAHAATCGITGSASAQPAVYDPFNPTGLTATNITLNLTRVNTSGGGDTRIVNFYLKANPQIGTALDGTSLVPTVVAGSVSSLGTGNNIFYDFNATPPTVSPTSLIPSGSNRFLQINFTGNNAGSDTAQVTFQVSLPANLNLSAIQNLSFDAFFGCNVQGGQDNGKQQTGSFANAVSFPVVVLSALRTYYAGTALDFGEIGNVTTASLAGTPQRTNPANHVFVQSSGAYSVTLASQNAFKLKKPGAVTGQDEIKYSLHFLGFDRDNTTNPTPNAVAITRSCQRATLSTVGNSLPVVASLQEGGSGKNPSPTYSDILTVTVTPLIYSDPGTSACATL